MWSPSAVQQAVNTYGTRGDRWALVVEILQGIGVPTIVEQTASPARPFTPFSRAPPRELTTQAPTQSSLPAMRENA